MWLIERETTILRVEPARFRTEEGGEFSWVTVTKPWLSVIGTSYPRRLLEIGAVITVSDNPNGLPEIVGVRPHISLTPGRCLGKYYI